MRSYHLWLRVYKRAIERAYQLGVHGSFVTFNRRGGSKTDNSLIKDVDAYAVAEAMETEQQENALYWERKLGEL